MSMHYSERGLYYDAIDTLENAKYTAEYLGLQAKYWRERLFGPKAGRKPKRAELHEAKEKGEEMKRRLSGLPGLDGLDGLDLSALEPDEPVEPAYVPTLLAPRYELRDFEGDERLRSEDAIVEGRMIAQERARAEQLRRAAEEAELAAYEAAHRDSIVATNRIDHLGRRKVGTTVEQRLADARLIARVGRVKRAERVRDEAADELAHAIERASHAGDHAIEYEAAERDAEEALAAVRVAQAAKADADVAVQEATDELDALLDEYDRGPQPLPLAAAAAAPFRSHVAAVDPRLHVADGAKGGAPEGALGWSGEGSLGDAI
eukprot:7378594-Prymnesium_polylepis.1